MSKGGVWLELTGGSRLTQVSAITGLALILLSLVPLIMVSPKPDETLTGWEHQLMFAGKATFAFGFAIHAFAWARIQFHQTIVAAKKKSGPITRFVVLIWMGGAVLFFVIGGTVYIKNSYKEHILGEEMTWGND